MEKKREKQDKNKENKKKQKNQQWILIMIYYIMFAVCGAVGMMYVEEIRGEDVAHNLLIGEISVILCVIVVFLLHIIIHEAGHFVFGLLSGYRFSSFRIGNIMFIKKNGKLQVKKFSVMGTGGQCLMVPPECSWEQLPYRLYNLGGPLMNILFSVAGGLWYTHLYKLGIFAAVPLLLNYNGQRKFKSAAVKWSFYVFYPLHMGIIAFIKFVLI